MPRKGNRFSRTLRPVAIATSFAVIFSLLVPTSAATKFETIYKFTGGTDGQGPRAGLIQDTDGKLYGTTFFGGAYGWGTVFQLSPSGDGNWQETVLHSFNLDGTDGAYPWSSMIFDPSGNLYGTTTGGGTDGRGTVFQLTQNGNGDWTENVIYSFHNAGGDGFVPDGLIFDASGNLFGNANEGGAFFNGAVFELSPSGNGTWIEKVLYSFCALSNCADGATPVGNLIFDSAGNLYGTTQAGGAYGMGGSMVRCLSCLHRGTDTG
jgi:uncharacterized repeat protein (TIGR03803 family)